MSEINVWNRESKVSHEGNFQLQNLCQRPVMKQEFHCTATGSFKCYYLKQAKLSGESPNMKDNSIGISTRVTGHATSIKPLSM